MSELLGEFVAELLNNPRFAGDLLEFGTGSGFSAEYMARATGYRIITFDGFKGLPKTEKITPKGTNCYEGGCHWDEKTTRERLRFFPKVQVETVMMENLRSPSDYGIQRVCGANMDLDLYEGTRDALAFLDKCEWEHLLLRFDDWGADEKLGQVREEMWEHEKAAFMEFVIGRGYMTSFYEDLNRLSGWQQIIVSVTR